MLSPAVRLIALLVAAPALAQEKENPIEKEVKASLKDPTKPFVMYVHIKIKDGTATKFEAAFAKQLQISEGRLQIEYQFKVFQSAI